MSRSPACPACAEPLVVFELEGIEIDRCLACGGTWLDGGEIALIAERAGVPPQPFLAMSARTAAHPRNRLRARAAAGGRACPRCRARLEAIPASAAAAPVELDRCPRGDGLWFDAGELERILRGGAPGGPGRVVGGFLAKLLPPNRE